jgi:hypothetical protein
MTDIYMASEAARKAWDMVGLSVSSPEGERAESGGGKCYLSCLVNGDKSAKM